jgi:predicted helicase
VFDTRYIVYDDQVITRPRREVMQHVLKGNNLMLVSVRKGLPTHPFTYFFVSDKLVVNGAIRSDNQSIDTCYPLFAYRNGDFGINGEDTFPYDAQGRSPNLNVAFVRHLEQTWQKTFMQDFMPEDVFYYAYAVFHSPTYRARYAEFLKIDFPRLPVYGWSMAQSLIHIGRTLVELHLMEHPSLRQRDVTFPISGDDTVEKRYPRWQNERVYMNTTQYFAGISATEWAFTIGGYQVLEKWLKDRQGKPLSYNEMVHYQRVCKVIRETLRLMHETEAVVKEVLG